MCDSRLENVSARQLTLILRVLVALAVAGLLWLGAVAVRAAAAAPQLSGTSVNRLNHPAIEYATRPTRDPIAELTRRIEAGTLQLKADGPSGYLRSLLDALDVPVESEMALFVRDSVQASRISVGNPRTLFFNDSIAVGWVRGGFIEIASQDPQQGVIFYALTNGLLGRPVFTRSNGCLTCHYSYPTTGIPGMLLRSVGEFTVDHRTPIERRWGGWYVTGDHGALRHMGNADVDRLFDLSPPTGTFNWPSFAGRFDTSGYLTSHSDIGALLVFDHQMHMMNLLTRIGWEARAGGEVPLADAAREVVDYMLFVDEAPLPNAVQGSTRFAEIFTAKGPRDRAGRSLRQLDLAQRLLRYRCSYMIYSDLFTALPAAAKSAIYERMFAVLSGRGKDPRYARLPQAERRAILEILRDTKADWPRRFS